jgi:hypothetical protein
VVSKVSMFLSSAYLEIPSGRRLFGEGLLDLELEGKSKDTRHRFRQVKAVRVA